MHFPDTHLSFNQTSIKQAATADDFIHLTKKLSNRHKKKEDQNYENEKSPCNFNSCLYSDSIYVFRNCCTGSR